MKKILLSILLVLLVSTASSGFPPPASPSLNSIVGLWASGSCTGFLKSDGTCTEGTVDETDPIVGAITGLVKANGAGTIGAASAGTDYIAPTSATGITLKLGDHAGANSFSITGDDDSTAFSVTSAGIMGGISALIPPYKEAAPTAYQLEWDTNFLTSRAALCGHDNTGVVCFSGSATAPSADGQFLVFDNDAKAFTPYAMSGGATMTDGGVVSLNLTTYASDIGSATSEIGDVYMGDGKIIKGQADQSCTLTSSATGWSVNLPFGLYSANDPDVAAEGKISWDANGDVIRGYDGTRQVAVARVQEEIHVTVIKPQDMADAVRDAFLVWSNESGMSFVITGWKAWSGTDDTTLNIEETDADGQNNATVDAVEIATDGTGLFYASDTTITGATIENGHLLWLDFDDTDDPTYVKLTIYGYYNADVN